MEDKPMEKKSIPKFYGLRIYLTSMMLYFFLVIPFIGFIVFQYVPQFIENNMGTVDRAKMIRDSIHSSLDTLPGYSEQEIDSLVSQAIQMAGIYTDTIVEGSDTTLLVRDGSLPARDNAQDDQGRLVISGPGAEDDDNVNLFHEKGPFSRYFSLFFLLLLVSLILGLIYNLPFKRFFRLARTKKEIPAKLHAYCKKHLLRAPLINSFIITLPNIVVFIYSMIFLVRKVSFEGEVEREMFIQLHYLTLVATILEILFVYYWQKHRVHIRYIDHVFSETELRKRIFKKK